MKKNSCDVVPNWFFPDRYANIELTPNQWRLQLEARVLIRSLVMSPETIQFQLCRNNSLLKIAECEAFEFASRLAAHIAIEPILPADYFIRTYFDETMTGELGDKTIELTGTKSVVGFVRKPPYVAPLSLGKAIVISKLADDAGYSIPNTYFNPPAYHRDANEMIREFPERFICGIDSPLGGTEVYASIDLNGPDDALLNQLRRFIRLQRKKFNIEQPVKPQHKSIGKLLDYKTLEILDLENWALLNEVNILSSVYRELFDGINIPATRFRTVHRAFAHRAIRPEFLKHLSTL